jgi:anti-sigma factor (TIGR02949 family)
VTHRELELQLDAYVDGELAPGEAQELEAHLQECGECARLHDARMALSNAIREQVPAWRAPDELRKRVQSALHEAAGARTPHAWARTLPLAWRSLALAASLAAVAVGSWRFALDRARGNALADQVLASHVRALMPGHLTDVASSDQHTVKPWFNGKLDFSPPVYDFAGRGFPLIGGRLDYVGSRPVATLVYARRQHVIDVFLWPAAQETTGGPTVTRQGYHLLTWTTQQYVYWVASDLEASELRDFAELLQRGDSAAAH